MSTKQSEREMVRDMAQRWLNRADANQTDPDNDQCAMSRQYLRALEKIERMTELLRIPVWPLGSQNRVMAEVEDKWPQVDGARHPPILSR